MLDSSDCAACQDRDRNCHPGPLPLPCWAFNDTPHWRNWRHPIPSHTGRQIYEGFPNASFMPFCHPRMLISAGRPLPRCRVTGEKWPSLYATSKRSFCCGFFYHESHKMSTDGSSDAVTKDPSLIPAFPPPPGKVSNFNNQDNYKHENIILHAVVLSFTTTRVLIRLYTRSVIKKRFGVDDGKTCAVAFIVGYRADYY